MATPNKKDVFKPWEHPLARQVPSWCLKDGTPSQAKYFTWLRSQLRSTWSDNPLRIIWKNSQLRPVTQEEKKLKLFHTSTKNVGQCYLCSSWFAGSKLEVDHKEESGGCYDFETAEEFMWHCAANPPENWALVCKPCHKIKSHADRYDMDFEEAVIAKKVIAICKVKDGDKEWLRGMGVVPDKNTALRKKQIRELLTKEGSKVNET